MVKQAYAACTADAQREAHGAHAAVARLHGEVAQCRRDARAAFAKAPGGGGSSDGRGSGRSRGRSEGSRRSRSQASNGSFALAGAAARNSEGPRNGAVRPRGTHSCDSGASSPNRSAAEAPPGAFPWHPLTASVGRGASAQPLLGTLEVLMEELDLQKELAKAAHEAQQGRHRPGRSNGPLWPAAANSLPPVWEKASRAPVLAPLGSFY